LSYSAPWMEDIGVGQRPEDVSWEIEKSLCMVQQLVVRLVWRLTFFVHGRMMAEVGDWYREFFIWEWCDCECDVIRDRVLLGLFVILVLLDGVSVEAKQLSWFIVVVQEGLSAWSKLPWFGGSMEGNLLLYVSPRWPAAAGHPRAWPSPFFNCDESTDLLCFCWCSWRRPSRKVLGSSLDGALSQAIILWTVCNLLISITVRWRLISRVLDWWDLCSGILLEFGWVVSGMLPSLSWFFGSLSALFFTFTSSFIHQLARGIMLLRIQIWSTSQ